MLSAWLTIAACATAADTPSDPSSPTTRSPSEVEKPDHPIDEEGLSATALSSYSARLSWTAPSETAEIYISRDGRLIDRVDGSASSYVDYLLWKETRYAYKVSFRDRSGEALSDLVDTITTPEQTAPFPRLYSSSSFWNGPIPPDASVDRNSAEVVAAAIDRYRSTANLVISDRYGYPIAYADPSSRLYDIGCIEYDCNARVLFRVPAYATPKSGSDGHLTVLDPSTGRELDMYGARCCWSANSRYVTEANGWGAICARQQRCNGAVAAGFAAAGGLIRPEEVAQGRIDHALALAMPYTRADYIACPATHTDGRYAYPAIPLGARVQLDPAFDVDAQRWPAWQKVVAKALQVYGAYVVDTSGSLAVRAEGNQSRGYDAWSKIGVRDPSLTSLPWSRMRVLRMDPC